MKPIRIGEIVEITKGILLQGDESMVVTSVVYDSRQQVQGAFFVPIVGEKTDGHRFIEQVLKQGAVGSFTSQKNIPMPCFIFLSIKPPIRV